ncbi:hypothetical protein EO244_13060 [Ancylomarina salipaludis]|uniref:Uncharacterized protein n=1 Tax=Ancylomarina salipaludis TaxID=2501299 RepID=A0A4Q1JKL1_9BACT|nr:hypothetical protein [Ancylomarina salipaludis]RXQ91027.1 hypothetical protein EO244_13060 [Ancylomarina salipaludis]
MKYIITLILGITILSANGQELIQLEKVGSKDSLIENQAIIYGNFIQRLGFSSGGFPQDIRIQNIETKEFYKFRVKPTYKSRKENPFIFHIPAGKYRILVYWWTKSQWYGGKMFTEPIFKGIDASTKSYRKKSKSGKIQEKDFEQYEFTIEKNTTNYLGTWHFNTGLVSFSNDKIHFDKEITSDHEYVDFQNAVINLPQ